MTVIDFLVTYGTPFVLGVLLAGILLEIGDLREFKREHEALEHELECNDTAKAHDQILQDRPIPMEHEHDT